MWNNVKTSSQAWNFEKHKVMNMKQETQVSKCKNEFPSIGSLKKHLIRIYDVTDLTLEEYSEISNFVNTHVFYENI